MGNWNRHFVRIGSDGNVGIFDNSGNEIAHTTNPNLTLNSGSVVSPSVLSPSGYNLEIIKIPLSTTQNLTAQTTTSTTPINFGSINITPLITGNIKITMVVRGSNNTLADGITVGLYNGSTLLLSETYTQEGLASNEHSFVLSYYLTGQTLNQSITINAMFNAVTGGTASVKLIELSAVEY